MFTKAQPPRTLLLWIAAITVLPLATLLWLGWRLIAQDRILEAQRAQERVERSADLLVAALQRALSSSEQRLAAGAEDWPEGAVSIVFASDHVEAHPPQRLAYVPVAPVLRESPAATFADGEDLEFRKQDHAAAIETFRQLAASTDPAIRAGALLRLGRNLAEIGQSEQALAAYEQLTSFDDVGIGGAPASLLGRYARCDLFTKTQRASELRAEAERFAGELRAGRWRLAAPLYWLYSGDISRWTDAESAGKRETEVFAEAAASMWNRRFSLPPNGREAMTIGGRKLIALWQHAQDSQRILIAGPEFVKSQWLAAAESVAAAQGVEYRVDENPAPGAAPAARRTARQTDLPWNLLITGSAAIENSDFALRRRLLVGGFVLLVAMALTASYVIIRAINRELAVARLQSDFVAAVS